MALIKCEECGNDVSTTAESCPKCGAKLKSATPNISNVGCGGILLAIIIVAIIFSVLDIGDDSNPSKPAKSATSTPAIPYLIVREWEIPNGGFGRVIVIDPKYRNEKEMRRFGKELARATSDDRNAFIFIYDDKLAAAKRDAALGDRLNAEDIKLHDAHMIGGYQRNINTGHHELQIWLEGLDGPVIQVRMFP